jgi:nucleolysin TIA-1/TIAR
MKTVFVGKLSLNMTESDLRDLFDDFGPLGQVKVIAGGVTGLSAGYGYVELIDELKAEAAIRVLDGHMVHGGRIMVNEAHPMSRGRWQH